MSAATISVFNVILDVATSDDKGPTLEGVRDTATPQRPTALDFNVIPEKSARVDATEAPPPRTMEDLLPQTLERASGLLTEDNRLRDDVDDALVVLWLEDNFRHAAPEFEECVMETFVDGGGRLDESLRFCYRWFPVKILSDKEVATLDRD